MPRGRHSSMIVGHVARVAEQVRDDDGLRPLAEHRSIVSAVTLQVAGSTSAKTGIAPW